MTVTVIHADCRVALAAMPERSVDAIVTDPPYELGFMGKEWDSSGIAYDVALWREALRVAKPGAFLAAFGGTRTYHRMACAIEDAGWELRDSLAWIYGSGMPKSHNVSKAIDKHLGAGSPQSAAWEGWGTALKPSHEPIVIARKPLIGTVSANVLTHGTGGIHVDACRLAYADAADMDQARVPQPAFQAGYRGSVFGYQAGEGRNGETFDPSKGRWPANTLLSHDHDEDEPCAEGCPVAAIEAQSGMKTGAHGRSAATQVRRKEGASLGSLKAPGSVEKSEGGASRFFPCFYSGKASSKDRGEGNTHPTVKPLAVMRWLVRLVTPPGGKIVDPFAGSGTTLLAARAEGFDAVGIELEAAHVEIIRARLTRAEPARSSLFARTA